MDPGTSHLERLEAAQRQLLVFAGEINHLHQAERARAAELERAMERLRGSYLDMMKTLAADEQLRYGFLPHDVGKVGLPEAVLNKPGPLDAREWEVMRAHPLPGVQMVAGSKSLGSAVEVIRWHHERWDGKGYQSGLAGEAIPAGARVLSVADAFDAIVPDLHASLDERSLHDRSPHGGPPHDVGVCGQPGARHSLSPLRSPSGGLSPEPGRRGMPRKTLQREAAVEVLAEVERSGFVESRHLGAVAVADADGRLLATAGDPELVTYVRSCAKPFQALAVRGLGVEDALGLGQVALAGACGSHNGEPDHVASVRKVLEAAGLDETALRCPPAMPTDRTARQRVDGPAAVYHNCSGKHAYMLAGSVVRGWAPERYTEPDHPLQAVVGDTLSDFAGTPLEHVGVDGCGVPVHAMSLRGLATAYARLGARAAAGEEGPAAVVEAVSNHPFMLAGTGQLDTLLVEASGGRVLAKVGAEAAYGAVDLATGTGLALKVLDGAPRARAAALLAALRALDWLDEDQWEALLPAATVDIHGGGQTVGAVRPAELRLSTPD